MLTFLSPAPALLAAAISIPLLLLIYFLKLRRRPLRVSSTLLWEQAAKDLQVNVPFRWLRISTVFLLQLAALAALLLALARPAIKGAAPVADRVTIIIDHSASMSARDGHELPGASPTADQPPTRLDEAKARAITLVRELARGTTSAGERPAAMVIASAATARVVQSYTSVTSDLIDAINAIGPTDQPGDIAAAAELLEAARAALPPPAAAGSSDSDAPPANEQAVAFTDLPFRVQPDTRGVPIRIIRITPRAQISPDTAAGGTTPLSASTPDNLGIVALSVRRDLENQEIIHAFARIVSTARQPANTIVRCLIDGAPVNTISSPDGAGASARRVTIPAATDKSPGETSITFDFTHRSRGVVVIAIDRPDLLDSDNAAAATIGPVTTPGVLVVAPGSPSPEPDQFLMGFLESTQPRVLRAVDVPAFAAEMADARSESRRPWRDFNLIVFDRVTPAPGDVPPQPTISFGAGLPLPGLTLRPPPASSAGAIRFDTWRRADPLMRYVALDPIIISPPPPTIETTEVAPANGASTSESARPISDVRPLASGPDGPIIAAQQEPGVGPRRIVISFPLARSNWAPDTSFAVFMANAVDLLTGRGDAAIGRSFTTAEPVTVHADPGAQAIEIAGPITRRFEIGPTRDASAEPAARRPVSLGVLERSGVYRVTGAEEPAVCANTLSEHESLLGSAAASVTSVDPPPREPVSTPTGPNDRSEGRREVWHWFVLLAAALAAIEWTIFAFRVRA